jgi:hypothetical protein
VPRDQGREGRLIAAKGEIIEELPVGPPAGSSASAQLLDVPQECAELCRGHV